MSVKIKLAAVALTLASLSSGVFAASYVYQTASNPWNNTTNDNALNAAFGSGNWTKSGYDLSGFTGASFVFLDGSDGNANSFSSFLSTNLSALESFVSNGGHLFINAAPNQGSSIGLGFGGTVLNYSYPNTFSNNATVNANGVAAGLTNGGITTQYTGNWFSHANLTGSFTSMIEGDAGTIFASKKWGKGLVAFGGQTTTNWHQPSADAQTLLKNELLYVSTTPVPEPETYALMLAGLGVIGLVAQRRKSSRKTA